MFIDYFKMFKANFIENNISSLLNFVLKNKHLCNIYLYLNILKIYAFKICFPRQISKDYKKSFFAALSR